MTFWVLYVFPEGMKDPFGPWPKGSFVFMFESVPLPSLPPRKRGVHTAEA